MSDFRLVYNNPDGSVSIVVPAPGITEEQAAAAVPRGTTYEVLHKDDVPTDRTFRNAWVKSGAAIDHDMDKVKTIAHDKRRAHREELFKPYDEAIAKQLPVVKDTAEAARSGIRAQDAAVQSDIDAAASVDEVKTVLQEYGAV